jgi:hypothetical protein
MDYHFKFRMDSMKQASSTLGGKGQTRLPANSTPAPMLFRPKCQPVRLDRLAETNGTSSSKPATPPPSLHPEPGAKDSPQVKNQVKQLQFWLKVFSRFCQDDHIKE